jgi:hypothetical protein
MQSEWQRLGGWQGTFTEVTARQEKFHEFVTENFSVENTLQAAALLYIMQCGWADDAFPSLLFGHRIDGTNQRPPGRPLKLPGDPYQIRRAISLGFIYTGGSHAEMSLLIPGSYAIGIMPKPMAEEVGTKLRMARNLTVAYQGADQDAHVYQSMLDSNATPNQREYLMQQMKYYSANNRANTSIVDAVYNVFGTEMGGDMTEVYTSVFVLAPRSYRHNIMDDVADMCLEYISERELNPMQARLMERQEAEVKQEKVEEVDPNEKVAENAVTVGLATADANPFDMLPDWAYPTFTAKNAVQTGEFNKTLTEFSVKFTDAVHTANPGFPKDRLLHVYKLHDDLFNSFRDAETQVPAASAVLWDGIGASLNATAGTILDHVRMYFLNNYPPFREAMINKIKAASKVPLMSDEEANARKLAVLSEQERLLEANKEDIKKKEAILEEYKKMNATADAQLAKLQAASTGIKAEAAANIAQIKKDGNLDPAVAARMEADKKEAFAKRVEAIRQNEAERIVQDEINAQENRRKALLHANSPEASPLDRNVVYPPTPAEVAARAARDAAKQSREQSRAQALAQRRSAASRSAPGSAAGSQSPAAAAVIAAASAGPAASPGPRAVRFSAWSPPGGPSPPPSTPPGGGRPVAFSAASLPPVAPPAARQPNFGEKMAALRAQEKAQAMQKAQAYWAQHPNAQAPDKRRTAKMVYKASEYTPKKNDFPGIDTRAVGVREGYARRRK